VLDNVTKTFVKRGISVPLQLTDAESMLLGRWAGKVAYNMQRVCIREGTQGEEPQFPKSAIAWILGTGKSDEIRVAASWVPVSEAVRENFGVFASNGTFLPRRYVQAGPLVMFVAWAHPQLPESTLIVHEKDCKRVPAVAISHPSKPTIELPSMADTSMLLKGLAHMRDIAAELLKRLDSLAP
jgi:hypothetical protein